MKNTICIDLTKFNYEKLKDVSNELDLDYDVLVRNKKKGFAKIFVNTDLGIIIAYTTKKNKSEICYTGTFDEALSKMKSFEITKDPVQLDTDSILEKISKYGIDSLNKDEKLYLDNLSNG